jgi:hypothetical protein
VQVPEEVYVRRVVPVTQKFAGGVLHTTSLGAYEQVPALQVPLAAKVRRVVPLAQVGPGGVVQLTPAQGSPAHAPFEQPFAQVESVCV